MNPQVFIADVRKYQQLTGATDADIRKVTGWSKSTMQRRIRSPGTITLDEANSIEIYLGIGKEDR